MTPTRLDIIDGSVEKAHIWLNDLAELDSEDGHQAYRVLRAFLHALRDHLPMDEGERMQERWEAIEEPGPIPP